MEKFLQQQKEIVARDFVVVKIDTSEMKHGAEVAKRLRKKRTGGIPWMVVLDDGGKELISSDGPKGNCGYPLLPHEVEHFVKMIRDTSSRITDEQLAERCTHGVPKDKITEMRERYEHDWRNSDPTPPWKRNKTTHKEDS